jgi:hypothetical protein
MTTHQKKEDQSARVIYPLPNNSQTKSLATTCDEQATTVLANPDIANHPEVAAAANTVKAQAKVVSDTAGSIVTEEAVLTGLRAKRLSSVLLLRLVHANMESLVNVAAGGDKTKAATWGGKIASRTTYVASTDPPVDALAQAKGKGAVEARCKAEKGVICYLMAMGTDPAHPEAWPQPFISGGCKHTFEGLTMGQKVYLRIAVVRTGGVQGKWSDMLEVTVS